MAEPDSIPPTMDTNGPLDSVTGKKDAAYRTGEVEDKVRRRNPV
jgi:hypothetical protein